MNTRGLIICFLLMLCCNIAAPGQNSHDYVILVHGGAGIMKRGSISKADEQLYRQGIQRALDAGRNVLAAGGTAIDAVQAAITVLEDDSMFNAGKGAVVAANGRVELDASIMDGKTLGAGAVAGVGNVKNPIVAARGVMDVSGHVMLAREGAEAFAKKNGCVIVDPSYFLTEKSKKQKQKFDEQRDKKSMLGQPGNMDSKYGTVGAVALDKQGNLASGTSTGGMTGKKYGRVGDSPIIGAGTYADNNSCAVSCTGWGEYFIRLGMAKSVCDRVELQNMPVKKAASLMIHTRLQEMGATGGLIAVDKDGNIAVEFNTEGMHRGWIRERGETVIELYKD